MTVQTLKTPIVTADSIRSVNFFNGRLLSGEDLTHEQEANRAYQQLLGKAIGEGVVHGLEVTQSATQKTTNPTVVSIAAGLAINRTGQMLQLEEKLDLDLSSISTPSTGANISFGPCKSDTAQLTANTTAAAVYLLMITPAEIGEGRAPVSGLGNIDAGCNTRYNAQGVSFRMIQLDFNLNELSQPAKLRNLLAYRCFGAPDLLLTDATLQDPLLRFAQNPYDALTTTEQYGLLDSLRQQGKITNCDVPLAAIFWRANGGIGFIDLWSVRRRPTVTPPAPAVDGRWRVFTGDRALAEAEARFLQFQDHVRDLQAVPNDEISPATVTDPQQVYAADRFNYLPPFGIVPIRPPPPVAASPGAASTYGFSSANFLGNTTLNSPALIDGNSLRQLYHEALQIPPISLTAGDKVQLYVIWENLKAVESGTILPQQLAMVFASTQLPFRGVARYDWAHWNLDSFN